MSRAEATPPDAVIILAGNGEAEWREQRSRFIGLAFPAAGMIEARAAIEATARRYHDARHVCHAWRLGALPPPSEARNDDGEPSGTAGEPILAAIRKSDLVDTVVIVVRYFGGVKLGTGGLARAYGRAAALALEVAPRRVLKLGRRFVVRFPYHLRRAVEKTVTLRGGHAEAEQYADNVSWEVWLPHSGCADFAAAIAEATAGGAEVTEAHVGSG